MARRKITKKTLCTVMKKTYCNRNEACYLHITRLKTLLLSGSVCDLGIKTEPILLENFLELFTGGYFRP